MRVCPTASQIQSTLYTGNRKDGNTVNLGYTCANKILIKQDILHMCKKNLNFHGRKAFLTIFSHQKNYFPLSVQQFQIGKTFSECKSPENNNNIVLMKKGGERSALESLALTS